MIDHDNDNTIWENGALGSWEDSRSAHIMPEYAGFDLSLFVDQCQYESMHMNLHPSSSSKGVDMK